MTQEIPRDILSGWTILVVDDEEDSLEVVRLMLSFYQAHVLTAQNGAEGFTMAETHIPRFIISDLSMPVMDGWTLVRKLKADERLKNIPVIALTAHAMIGDRKRGLAAGFHNYLTKPLNPPTFVRDLLELLMDIPALANHLQSYQS